MSIGVCAVCSLPFLLVLANIIIEHLRQRGSQP
jgi:hypothetical protein